MPRMDRILARNMVNPVAHALQARELPSGNSPLKWIVGGSIAGGIFVIVILLALYFHFKRRARERLELDKDLREMDDFGLTDYNAPGAGAGGYREDDRQREEDFGGQKSSMRGAGAQRSPLSSPPSQQHGDLV